MRHFVRTAVAGVCAAASVAIASAPAHAGMDAGETDNGYAAKVQVHLSGDVSGGLVASVPGPPPMCWWEDLSVTMLDSEKVDTSDPEAVKKYYDEEVRPYLTGHAAVGQLSMPDGDYYKSIIAQVKAGKKMTFYALQTRDGAVSGEPGTAGYASDVRARRQGLRGAGRRRSLRTDDRGLAGVPDGQPAGPRRRARGPRRLRLRGDGPQEARARVEPAPRLVG